MLKPRWLLAALIVALGCVQAWDSRVLQAEPYVQVLVGIGIVLPALAVLLSSNTGVRLAAVLVAAALLVTARVASSIRLPELMLVGFFPAVVVLFDHVRAPRGQTTGLKKV